MPATRFALVDCNSFYASCEQVFAPALAGRPVVVLSNNDGCIVARSAEAKTMGIPMGVPYFQVADDLRTRGVAVFSSNYALYGDMSARVMRLLAGFAPRMEVYSIDEAFLELADLPSGEDPTRFCRAMRERIRQCTGIGVGVGVGPTKTLAKIANRFAKKHKATGGVFDLTQHSDIAPFLSQVDVADVWGVGRRTAAKLRARSIRTALDLRDADTRWVRKALTVTGLHTVLELRGTPCHQLETGPPPKQSICSSRSFGRPVRSADALAEAVASYASRAAEKLRAQGHVAGGVAVFARTDRHRPELLQHAPHTGAALPHTTDHTGHIVRAAVAQARAFFRKECAYVKAGVLLYGLEPREGRGLSLLDPPPEEAGRNERLMDVLDAVNRRYGRQTLQVAGAGTTRERVHTDWAMRRRMLSPRYTTSWDELPVVHAR